MQGGKRGSGTGASRNGELPRFDQALRKAKNDGSQVRFSLAVGITVFDDDEPYEVLGGTILEVDTYAVCVLWDGGPIHHREFGIWIGKNNIAGTIIYEASSE